MNTLNSFPLEVYLNKEYILDRGEQIHTKNIWSPYVLKNSKKDEFILFSEEEAFIWTSLSKNPSVKELIFEYIEIYNYLPWNLINEVFVKWKDRNIIINLKEKEISYEGPFKRLLKLNHLTFNIPILTVFINNIYDNFFKHIINKFSLFLFFIIGFSGDIFLIIKLVFNPKYIFINKESSLIIFISIIILSLLSILIHELAHGIALNMFGIKVKTSGIKLYNFIPLFFVDITQSFLKSKNKRLVISFAGVFINLMVAGFSAIFYIFVDPSVIRNLIGYFALINLANFAINLIPFIQLDGYYLLIELLNVVNLIDNSKSTFVKLISRKKIYEKDLAYLFFGFMYYLFTVVFLTLTFRALINNFDFILKII